MPIEKDFEKYNLAYAIIEDSFENKKRKRWDEQGNRMKEVDPEKHMKEIEKKKENDKLLRKEMEDTCEELGISYPELLRQIILQRLTENGRSGVDRKI